MPDPEATLIKLSKLACLLILFLYGCSDEGPKLRPLAKNAVILSFGDSLTYGTGAEPSSESYPAVLQNITGIETINAGVPGELSEQGAKRLPELLEKHQPALLILCHAGNDLLNHVDTAITISNLTAMITLAQSKNIDVLLLGVPKPGLFLNTADFYFEIASATKVPLADDILPPILADAKLKSDSVHPNKEGYKKMAEEVYQQLKKLGAI